jgi:hypothetical protein
MVAGEAKQHYVISCDQVIKGGVLGACLVISKRSSIMFSSHHHNDTVVKPLLTGQHPLFHTHPFYYSPAPSLLPSLSDSLLTVLAPVPTYWLTAGFFHILDLSNARWLLRYRIHDSAEVASRNRASRAEVFRAIILQQVIQTALAIVWVSEPPAATDHAVAMGSIARALVDLLSPLGALDSVSTVVAPLAYLLYWWAIPAARLFIAMYVRWLLSPTRLLTYLFPPPFHYVLGWFWTHGNTSSIASCI